MKCYLCIQECCLCQDNNQFVCHNCLNLGFNIHYDFYENGNLHDIRVRRISTDKMEFLIISMGNYWRIDPEKHFRIQSMEGIIADKISIIDTIKILKKRMKFKSFI